MDKKRKTTPILNGTYEVIGIVPGLVGCPMGMVDLATISQDVADQLIALKFPNLRKVEGEKVKASSK